MTKETVAQRRAKMHRLPSRVQESDPVDAGDVIEDAEYVDQIDAAEREYMQRLVADIKKFQRAKAAFENYQAYLEDKYGLQDGDTISIDGTINRKDHKG